MSASNAPYGGGETQPWPGYERRPEVLPVAPPQGGGGWPAGVPMVVKTKPSVMRIAFGVFLGLVMFSVLWVVGAVLMLGLFASVVSDTLNEIESTTTTSTTP